MRCRKQDLDSNAFFTWPHRTSLGVIPSIPELYQRRGRICLPFMSHEGDRMARWVEWIGAWSLPVLLLVGQSARAADGAGQLGPGVPAFAVRPGYRVTLVADKLDEARFLCFDDRGILYVSQPDKGAIVALRAKGDGRYEQVCTFVKDRPKVH